MSFMNIKDPEVRDAMIEDYLALKKRLKERNMEEHSNLILHKRDLQEHFEPIVMSNQKMAEEIVKDLIPIKDELREINRHIEIKQQPQRPKIGYKRRLVSRAYGPLAESFIQMYMDPDQQVDTTFGIRYQDGNPMMGDKIVKIEGDNIVIGDEVYIGTPGLWALITDKIPPTAKEYDAEDYERYKELLYETNVLHHHYEPANKYPRANRSLKWQKLLGPIWHEFQRDGIVDSSSDDDDSTDFHSTKDGEGVIYHPINGCRCYVQKNGRCFAIRAGNGIHFSPRPLLTGIRGGDGLYIRVGSSIYDGNGLLLGPHSPFKNIPILKWIL